MYKTDENLKAKLVYKVEEDNDVDNYFPMTKLKNINLRQLERAKSINKTYDDAGLTSTMPDMRQHAENRQNNVRKLQTLGERRDGASADHKITGQNYLPPPVVPWQRKDPIPYGDFNYNNEHDVMSDG